MARGTLRRLRVREMSDVGFSLVEVIVAVVLLTITSLPTALILINTNRTASYSHVQTEADDVATQVLEQEEQLSQNAEDFNPNLTTSTYSTVTIGQTVFNSTTTIYLNNSVTGVSPCLEPAGSGESQEIYFVTAKVTWHGEGGGVGQNTSVSGGPVSLTTELAPAAAGTGDLTLNGGEIAVPVQNLNTTLDVADNVWFQATGTYTGPPPAPSVPSGETISALEDTNDLGCAQFPNLDAAAGWSYQVTVAYCSSLGAVAGQCTNTSPAIVDFDENGGQAGAPGIPTQGGITVTAGSVTVVNPFYLAEAATVPVSFATYRYPSGGGNPTEEASTVWEPSHVRVGVENEHLQCNSVSATCPLGDAAATYSTSTGGSLYLYPYSDGYSPVYSGDENESNPLALSSATTPVAYYYNATGNFTQPTSVTPPLPPIPLSTQSSANTIEPTLTIQLYYAQITVTCSALAATHSMSGLTFTEVDGSSAAYTDPTGCTKATSPVAYNVGLPLGEYALSPATTSTAPTLSGAAHYIWVTPFGVCYSSSEIPQSVATPITNCASSVGTWTTGAASVTVT
jgi:Tfp pilus assembly protein PilV